MERLIQNYLLDLFAEHGIELDEPDERDEDEWLLTEGDFPAIGGIWHEGKDGQVGRLDIDIVLDEERRIEEIFPGIGGGKAGCRDALATFASNDFHVMLAACWHTVDKSKLAIERIVIGGRPWDAYIGNFTLRGERTEPLDVPDEAMTALQAVIATEPLTGELHWVRVFYGNMGDGRTQIEVLLDNKPWAAGDKALSSVNWPREDRYYSLRNFIALVPVE
ncbi:hypothetical protein EC912_10690 [Luteibacter rhizovicinus]|uniref:Uncharacterized protein n=1 Tax=Luteibacter rhizovicinus TaxID=242606 RepID=A0A4R3YKT2_9GAMM|nr:DUF6348 family protein [Luteibacter rhizovicinus]TCV92752.1 hypothetical protein EC912_10690 [Luteibacter rhizovicinus]